MKRYLNYCLILANVLVFISIAIVMALFISWRIEVIGYGDGIGGTLNIPQFNEKLVPLVACPIVFSIVGCSVLGFYEWKVISLTRLTIFQTSAKTIRILKIVSFSSVFNFIIPVLFCLIGILGFNTDIDSKLTFLIIGIVLSGVIGLTIIGISSYLNLKISFDKIRNEEKSKPKIEGIDEVSKKQQDPNNKKQDDGSLATSGSF